MARPVNMYFTNPNQCGPELQTASTFAQIVQDLCLTPEQYASSTALRAWVKRNKSFKYVPPDLLVTFGFEPGTEV